MMLLVVAGSALGHAPDEYWIIESANPKVARMDGAVRSYGEFFEARSEAARA
jgi:hypothetical protein